MSLGDELGRKVTDNLPPLPDGCFPCLTPSHAHFLIRPGSGNHPRRIGATPPKPGGELPVSECSGGIIPPPCPRSRGIKWRGEPAATTSDWSPPGRQHKKKTPTGHDFS